MQTNWIELSINELLRKFFDIHAMGIEVCPGIEPPKEAWEALVLYLAGINDDLAWQIGATVNRYPKMYHADICGWFATLLDRSHWTIEQWAYVERHVPMLARIEGLSIWIHRAVAKINQPDRQQACLEVCKNHGWNLIQFKKWLESQGVESDEDHYQTDSQYEADRQYQATIDENGNLKRQLAEVEAERVALKTILESTPKNDSFELPAGASPQVDSLRESLAQWLQSVGYGWIKIYKSGEMEVGQ